MPFNAVFSHIIKKRIPRIRNYSSSPISCQKTVLEQLLKKAQKTSFGLLHHFNEIRSKEQFQTLVPLSSYDTLYPYIKRQIEGEENDALTGSNLDELKRIEAAKKKLTKYKVIETKENTGLSMKDKLFKA